MHGIFVKPDVALLDSMTRLHIKYKEAMEVSVERRQAYVNHHWSPLLGDKLKVNVNASFK